MSEEIMTIKDVAQFLKVKEQTVYRLVQQGKIPALKIGGQWKVKRSHLDRMFEESLERAKESTRESIGL
ncbi:MAG TPA: helix-turn-helix domain-containing protein [Calditrichia bacterium]|nr:helix-turn-helix domain-containing protein [Calditrichota bacterium]HQU72937.1 helix-turn-helix domain-containing protein [Calditrichia bacterium]HQV34151.1 helix-turn-helix domain-containing protein [Calditrichia bacterium]